MAYTFRDAMRRVLQTTPEDASNAVLRTKLADAADAIGGLDDPLMKSEKLDSSSLREARDSSDFRRQQTTLPSESDINSSREGMSASGNGASAAVRRFSSFQDLGDVLTRLADGMGQMIEGQAEFGKALSRFIKSEQSDKRGKPDYEGEEPDEDDDDNTADSDDDEDVVEKAERILRAGGIPTITVKNFISAFRNERRVTNMPPSFVAKSALRAEPKYNEADLPPNAAMALVTAKSRLAAVANGAKLHPIVLGDAMQCIEDPVNFVNNKGLQAAYANGAG